MKNFFPWFLTLLWALLTLYLTTIPNFSPSSDSLFSWILSNGGHFFFFGTLAILLNFALYTSCSIRYISYFAVILTSIYGFIIEIIQLNVPGRSFDLKDWALDTLGAIIFLAIMNKYENLNHWWSRLYWGDHR